MTPETSDNRATPGTDPIELAERLFHGSAAEVDKLLDQRTEDFHARPVADRSAAPAPGSTEGEDDHPGPVLDFGF